MISWPKTSKINFSNLSFHICFMHVLVQPNPPGIKIILLKLKLDPGISQLKKPPDKGLKNKTNPLARIQSTTQFWLQSTLSF